MTVIEELLTTVKARQQIIEQSRRSKPPSSDDYEKPSPQSQHTKSSKKARGQTGHKGHNMALDNPECIEHNLSATLCKLS